MPKMSRKPALITATLSYLAYDTTTEWSGTPRATGAEAELDAQKHNRGCAGQGGYGSARAVTRDGDRIADLDGAPVWPPHGRATGAAYWPMAQVVI